MIIRSQFRDYYDGVAKSGIERSIVYNRVPVPFHYQSGYYSGLRSGSYALILFCGKAYKLIRAKTTDGLSARWCYDIEDVDKFVQSYCHKKDVEYYNGTRKRLANLAWYRGRFYNTFWSRQRKDHIAFFNRTDLPMLGRMQELQDTHGAPVVIYEDQKDSIVLNGKLEPFSFYRVVDAYTAFQEIQMFLSNIALPEKTIPHVSDRDMITAKGFDKFSFRKDPV